MEVGENSGEVQHVFILFYFRMRGGKKMKSVTKCSVSVARAEKSHKVSDLLW